MILWIEGNCLSEDVDGLLVLFRGKGLVSLVFESVSLINN